MPEEQTHNDLPSCRHAAECPGCPLIATAYPEQLRIKAERVRRTLSYFSGLGWPDVHDAQPADGTTHYRLRAKLVCSADGALGLFRAGTLHKGF